MPYLHLDTHLAITPSDLQAIGEMMNNWHTRNDLPFPWHLETINPEDAYWEIENELEDTNDDNLRLTNRIDELQDTIKELNEKIDYWKNEYHELDKLRTPDIDFV